MPAQGLCIFNLYLFYRTQFFNKRVPFPIVDFQIPLCGTLFHLSLCSRALYFFSSKLSFSVRTIIKKWLSHLNMYLESWSGFVKTHSTEFLIPQAWDGVEEFAFQASSPVSLMLLVQGPHSENPTLRSFSCWKTLLMTCGNPLKDKWEKLTLLPPLRKRSSDI